MWKLYQAVDTSEPLLGSDAVLQVVAYDSGVGTSSVKPLALIGPPAAGNAKEDGPGRRGDVLELLDLELGVSRAHAR